MARLVAFGCSLAHGMGLPIPDKQVWGGLLSNYLNREFVNQGIPGASNKQILHAIMNFEFQPDDLVFVLWTMIDRYGVLEYNSSKSEYRFYKFTPKSRDDRSINYYKNFHTDHDHLFLFKVFVEYSIELLKKKNIQPYNLFINEKVHLGIDTQSTFVNVYRNKFSNRYPKGIDGIHMGVEGNRDYAKAIYKELTAHQNVRALI